MNKSLIDTKTNLSVPHNDPKVSKYAKETMDIISELPNLEMTAIESEERKD
jgi:hypothetical protein